MVTIVLKSDPCGIETEILEMYDSGQYLLKSDPCGIETHFFDVFFREFHELKSDPCGIETDIHHGLMNQSKLVKIRPLWD